MDGCHESPPISSPYIFSKSRDKKAGFEHECREFANGANKFKIIRPFALFALRNARLERTIIDRKSRIDFFARTLYTKPRFSMR